MSEYGLTSMDFDKFQVLIDQYIERASKGFDEMPASIFFELLFARMVEQESNEGNAG